jgi:hypothetical protein
MLCTFCLESKLPRIAGPGLISAGHPAVTHVMEVPAVPRIGEEVFLVDPGQRTRHKVTRVFYVVTREKMQGTMVLLSDGAPLDD